MGYGLHLPRTSEVGNQVHQDDPVNEAVRDAFGVQDDNFTEEVQCMCGITDKAMSMFLELLRDAFPDANIPSSFYEAKKIINRLGLNYEKIDAPAQTIVCFIGRGRSEETCKKCHTSRFKTIQKGKKQKKKPAKILRYFPLKPRLQRLFMSSKTAQHMRWHKDDKNEDGKLRHPRDAEAWKAFDSPASFEDFIPDGDDNLPIVRDVEED
ncbi:hypothetical protein K1719_040233 [Acacia pycnantha]|nr:hypothetical protein K1719_040233 [Acacia pycnantha]